jgi:tetratricopeptide (TPR) repeat protein
MDTPSVRARAPGTSALRPLPTAGPGWEEEADPEDWLQVAETPYAFFPRDEPKEVLVQVARYKVVGDRLKKVQSDPSKEAYVELGEAFLLTKNFEAAIGTYRRALTIKPDYVAALCGLAEALAKTGDKAGAIIEFGKSLELAPPDIRANIVRETVTALALSVDKSKSTCYTSSTMDAAARIQAAAELLATVYPAEDVGKALEDLAAKAARETTARATAEARVPAPTPTPQPDASETATVDAPVAPRRVTAEELFGEVSPTRQAKPRQKYKFDPELLDNPKAVSAAESIANARTYKLRKGVQLAPDEDAKGKMAASFVKQAQRRRQGASPGAG